MSKVIGVDFDGVIHSYTSGWTGVVPQDPPMEGVHEALKKLKDKGFTIKIFTTRPRDYVWPYLNKYGLSNYISSVSNHKFPATIYIDDRGYRFNDWNTTISDLERLINVNSFNVAVIGSRHFTDYMLLSKYLDKITEVVNIDNIISGGAKGADSLGEKYAKENSINCIVHLPDWKKNGKAAGYIRNNLIVEDSDLVVAFWDGVSRGTRHSIDLAKKLGKKVKIVQFNTNVF